MKIVDEITNQIRCECGAILNYDDEDVIKEEYFKPYVICPKCGTKMCTEPPTVKELKDWMELKKLEYRRELC